jgi:hypothetical protein
MEERIVADGFKDGDCVRARTALGIDPRQGRQGSAPRRLPHANASSIDRFSRVAQRPLARRPPDAARIHLHVRLPTAPSGARPCPCLFRCSDISADACGAVRVLAPGGVRATFRQLYHVYVCVQIWVLCTRVPPHLGKIRSLLLCLYVCHVMTV